MEQAGKHQFTDEERSQVVTDFIEVAMVKGLSMKSSANPAEVAYSHVPISLFPTPYPVEHYENAKQLQNPLEEMIGALVRKPDIIHEVLRYFQEQDPFLKRLVDMSKKYNSPSQKFRQNYHSLILRSDYMIDAPTNSLKLVEYNTIASSLSSHCQNVKKIQQLIRQKYGDRLSFNYTETPAYDDLINSENFQHMARVFNRTCELYLQSTSTKTKTTKDLCVLFVIDEGERNICDQKLIEVELFERFGICSLRMTFAQLAERLQRDEETGTLFVDKSEKQQGREVAFVYYRTGYQVEHYKHEKAWETRELLECSIALKCPSIDVHLTTFKKFQQAFSDEALLKKVMGQQLEREAEKIKGLFKGIWTLEYIETDPEVQQVVQKAITNPKGYVIKPQKEGGGNNFYGFAVKEMLEKAHSSPESLENLKQYLIMERIYPPEIPAHMVREGRLLSSSATLQEMGIYSSLFINVSEGAIPINEHGIFGCLVRTKTADSDEGGVVAGFSVVDQPFLTHEIGPLREGIIIKGFVSNF
ncbi:hypothetical protein FGO68_gene7423 [Halteria grandinella]|uniref:Glutathione synthetase n=1 Tax=Halteria grandinella TaxID=5974 RepID=A0A8J8NQY3_HALGN|nr:hypothetical protein FGO68_gene7423 [Halteria grandinella]